MNYIKVVFSKNILIITLLCIICLLLILFFLSIFRKKSLGEEKSLEGEKIIDGNKLDIPNKTVIHKIDTYEVIEIYDVLTEEECADLITIAKKEGLEDSAVLNYSNDEKTKLDITHRKSKQRWFLDSHNKILTKLANFTELITGLSVKNQEMTQVAMYEKEGRFNEHHDACAFEDKAYCNDINRHAGERKYTLLVYLNDDYTNGETEFTKINLKITPKKGMGIFFRNVDDNEVILPLSMHKSNVITGGEKWIATKWTHFKEYK